MGWVRDIFFDAIVLGDTILNGSIDAVDRHISQPIGFTLSGIMTQGVVYLHRVDASCLSGRMARI